MKASKTFCVLGAYTATRKSPTGIQGKRRDALCRAAKWLESSWKANSPIRTP